MQCDRRQYAQGENGGGARAVGQHIPILRMFLLCIELGRDRLVRPSPVPVAL
jgi:hypothetical protein